MYDAAEPVYSVTILEDLGGKNTTIQVGSSELILESAEDQGIRLPASCYAGKCISCTARLIEGKVEQDQVFLKPEEIAAGFVLTCKAYPRSNCVLLARQEEALLEFGTQA